LDLMISSNKDIVSEVSVDHSINLSDHALVKCTLNVILTKPKPILHTFRDFKYFNHDFFYHDLHNIPFDNIYYLHDINQKIELFKKYILNIFDIHAPLRTVRISKNKAPWLTPADMRLRNKALSRYKANKSHESWETYRQLRNYVS